MSAFGIFVVVFVGCFLLLGVTLLAAYALCALWTVATSWRRR